MFKKSLWILVGLLAIAVFVFAGCGKQAAKSGSTDMKTGSKCTMAGKVADANAVKKQCPKNCKKPCCVKKDAKCKVADANAMKNCPMKDKKACPKNCKKPCCAKKDTKCKTADVNEPNAPAKKTK
jgi:hypothetical protein